MRRDKKFKVRTGINEEEDECMYLDEDFMNAEMKRKHAKFYINFFKSPITDPIGEYYLIDMSFLKGS